MAKSKTETPAVTPLPTIESTNEGRLAIARTRLGASAEPKALADHTGIPAPSVRRSLAKLATAYRCEAPVMNETLGAQVHPYADAFDLLTEDEMEELANDIRLNGQREAIVVDAAGTIIDGRNRYAACLLAEVEPIATLFEGEDEAQVRALITSKNIHRRHLTDAQRRKLIRELVAAQGGLRPPGRPAKGETRPRAKDVAAQVGVNEKTVRNAVAEDPEEATPKAKGPKVKSDKARRDAVEKARKANEARAEKKAANAWRGNSKKLATSAVSKALTAAYADHEVTALTEHDVAGFVADAQAALKEALEGFFAEHLDD